MLADVNVVETVAHTQAGLHFYPDTDVIVDVGGQDIKLEGKEAEKVGGARIDAEKAGKK